MKRYALIVLAALAIAGCATWRREPAYLDFPEPPRIHFRLCELRSAKAMICMSQEDAAALAKWIDKVSAFEAARQRLLRN